MAQTLVCGGETRFLSPHWEPAGKRVEMSLDPGRQECLRHVTTADNVKLFLGGS